MTYDLYVCIYACMFGWCLDVCMHVCMCILCMYVYIMYVCVYVCMCICMYVYMFVCVYVCMYVCTYACLYFCISVCISVRSIESSVLSTFHWLNISSDISGQYLDAVGNFVEGIYRIVWFKIAPHSPVRSRPLNPVKAFCAPNPPPVEHTIAELYKWNCFPATSKRQHSAASTRSSGATRLSQRSTRAICRSFFYQQDVQVAYDKNRSVAGPMRVFVYIRLKSSLVLILLYCIYSCAVR